MYDSIYVLTQIIKIIYFIELNAHENGIYNFNIFLLKSLFLQVNKFRISI